MATNISAGSALQTSVSQSSDYIRYHIVGLSASMYVTNTSNLGSKFLHYFQITTSSNLGGSTLYRDPSSGSYSEYKPSSTYQNANFYSDCSDEDIYVGGDDYSRVYGYWCNASGSAIIDNASLSLDYETEKRAYVTINFNGGICPSCGNSNSHSDYSPWVTSSSINFNYNLGQPTRSGYEFLGWNTSSTATTAKWGPNTTSFSVSTGTSTTIYAIWKQIVTYTVSYSPGEGGSGSIASSTVQSGQTLTLSSGISFSRTGYTLKSWSGNDGNIYNLGQTITVTKNLILTAVWEINNYDIIFYDRKDATATTPFVKENYPYNTSIDLTDKRGFSFPGYNFLGWVEPSDFNKIIDSYNIKADNNQALYAIWELGSNIRVYTNENWQIAIPYIYENGKWKLSISKVFNNEEWRQ